MKPNILLLMVDQMRFDCLSILDHPVVETPNLDELAQKGVTFSNAYSATPTCVPARAAVLTGMSQESHGRVGYEDKVPWNYEHTLPGELANNGYHTQAVGKMHVYPTRKLMGFHNITLHDGYMHYNRFKNEVKTTETFEYCDDYLNWFRDKKGAAYDITDLGLDCNSSTMARPWELEEKYHPTNWTVQQSIDFLRKRDPSKPFFLKTSFVRPHPPFDPPKYFFDQYLNNDIDDPYVGEWAELADQLNEGLMPTTKKGDVPAARLRRARAAYYALISHIDFEIGRLINAMQEYGVLENTVILFTSDHGELLGDHNRFAKALPYEGSAHVPFILNDPGNVLGVKQGSTIDQAVELRDIMPTLLDIAGIKIPESVDGKTLLPLLVDEHASLAREFIHGEHTYGVESYHYVTNGKEKYIWFSQTGVEQYFNLEQDPYELKNEWNNPIYQTRIERLKQFLIEQLTGREEGYTDGTQLIVGKEPKTCLNHIR
ncbi:arylsulfatase [Paraliobacillus salinarum]|uniref:arylsulfatase n=1 Tax=Paraliobacillus salinarum TaxID=1158996 RepID=UPI0015F6C713|nr:arylsulfatase [Paraliobacillus salinarum]